MLQQVIVILIFVAAVAYAARLVFRSFYAKNNCASGCGKCGAIDLSAIEKQIKEKGV